MGGGRTAGNSSSTAGWGWGSLVGGAAAAAAQGAACLDGAQWGRDVSKDLAFAHEAVWVAAEQQATAAAQRDGVGGRLWGVRQQQQHRGQHVWMGRSGVGMSAQIWHSLTRLYGWQQSSRRQQQQMSVGTGNWVYL